MKPLRHRFLFSLLAIISIALVGCGEKGEKAIFYDDGLGREWSAPVGAAQLRIAVQNSFTSRSVVVCEGPAGHYEITVGPTRDRYMIIPAGEYEFSGYAYGKSVGNTQLRVAREDHGASRGFLVQIRP